MKKLIILGLLLFSACSQAVPITPSAAPAQTTPTAAATAVLTAIPPTIAPTATASPTALPSATLTATATASAMPTITQTPTIQPTYAVLRGTVMVGQAVCHYGPGALRWTPRSARRARSAGQCQLDGRAFGFVMMVRIEFNQN